MPAGRAAARRFGQPGRAHAARGVLGRSEPLKAEQQPASGPGARLIHASEGWVLRNSDALVLITTLVSPSQIEEQRAGVADGPDSIAGIRSALGVGQAQPPTQAWQAWPVGLTSRLITRRAAGLGFERTRRRGDVARCEMWLGEDRGNLAALRAAAQAIDCPLALAWTGDEFIVSARSIDASVALAQLHDAIATGGVALLEPRAPPRLSLQRGVGFAVVAQVDADMACLWEDRDRLMAAAHRRLQEGDLLRRLQRAGYAVQALVPDVGTTNFVVVGDDARLGSLIDMHDIEQILRPAA